MYRALQGSGQLLLPTLLWDKKCNTEVAASSQLGDKGSEKFAPMEVTKTAPDRRGSDARPADGQISVSQESEKRDFNSTTEKGAFLHELILLHCLSKTAENLFPA